MIEGIIVQFLPYIITGLLSLVATGLAWVKGKGWLREQFLDELEVDVGAIVNQVYQEYVRARKDANPDGKLTDEEAKQARQLAVDKLIALGKAKGKDYAKSHLLPLILDQVERWVNRKKGGNDK